MLNLMIMKIQKPTTLDAARLAAELVRYKKAVIDKAFIDDTGNRLHLGLRNPDAVLEFMVEKKYAYLGLTAIAERDHGKPVKALAGYTIIDAAQVGNDRIVELKLERPDRLGRIQAARLIFELMPNKGDACLIDDTGSIKWSLKKKDGEYFPPPKLKKPTALNFEAEKIKSSIEKPDQISDMIYGLNERDLVNLRLENQVNVESALESLRAYARKATRPDSAWIIFEDEQAVGYSLVSPALSPGESSREYDSALEMYKTYYALAAGQETEQDRLDSLIRILEKEIAREGGKLSSIQKELKNAEAAGTYRKYGELILANIDSIKKGAKAAHLQDFETTEYIDIELDPSKSASANAEDYFKRARKAASSVNILTARLESTKKRLAQLKTAEEHKDNFEEFEAELTRLKLISKKAGPINRKVIEPRLPYKRFRSSSGWEIWVGRTNRDNDELTFKLANKNDYWFHAWQAAGSHTVLRLPDKKAIPDKQTLLEAASLAAYFSKARTSSKVPVAYTQVRFVHKPRNFPPGKVTVDKEKELMVKPADPEKFMIGDEE